MRKCYKSETPKGDLAGDMNLKFKKYFWATFVLGMNSLVS
jgi:hypothetical protein